MAVKDTKMLASDKAAWKCLVLPMPATATGQTGLVVHTIRPGFNFEIVRVSVTATAVTATASVDVKIGTTTVLTGAITPVAAADTAGTLATSKAARRGSSTESINVEYTTNGTGVITNGRFHVWIRPYPMAGEAMPAVGL